MVAADAPPPTRAARVIAAKTCFMFDVLPHGRSGVPGAPPQPWPAPGRDSNDSFGPRFIPRRRLPAEWVVLRLTSPNAGEVASKASGWGIAALSQHTPSVTREQSSRF